MSNALNTSVQEIDPQSLSAWLSKAEQAGVSTNETPPIILDVREPWEVQTASLTKNVGTAEVVAIPMGQIPRRLAELDATRQIICMCHHGVRSLQVAYFLEHQGFDSVWNLSGGIERWARTVDSSIPRY